MTTQFEVFENPFARQRPTAPFVVVLQSHWLQVGTVVVAPLRPYELSEHLPGLQVPVTLDGRRYEVLVLELSHLQRRRLRRSAGSLLDFDYEIRRGLDRVFTGF